MYFVKFDIFGVLVQLTEIQRQPRWDREKRERSAGKNHFLLSNFSEEVDIEVLAYHLKRKRSPKNKK